MSDEDKNKEKIIGVYMKEINYIEKYVNEREEKGMEKGIKETRIEIAKALLKDKQPINKIAKITKLNIKDIEKINH